jgi:Rrf2 family iron-sulfur cluster assembly transcriptional regulator
MLARPASSIVISDVITAVNEPIRTTMCEEADRGCHQGSRCDTHQLWNSLGRYIYRFLDSITLQDVVDKNIFLDRLDLAPIEAYLSEPEPIVMEKACASLS